MSELMEKILAGKAVERERLAALSYEEKLALVEKMRDRGLLIKNPTFVQVSGNAVGLSVIGARLVESKPLVAHLLPDQLNVLQNSKTLSVELRKQPERWIVARVEEPEPEFAFPFPA
jgi:hypothetical protein